MSIHRPYATILMAALLGAGAPLATHAQAPVSRDGAAGGMESTIAAVRAATERFRDVSVALAEGYIQDPSGMCITSAMEGLPRQLGAMGVHYFRPDVLGITGVEPRVSGVGTHTDFLSPSVLIYEPQADGSLELVAVENLVWAGAWKEAGNTAAPEFEDNEFYYMQDNPLTEADEAHGFEPHYELHMWVYRENPSGLFAPFNPGVSCHAAAGHAAAH